MAHLKGKISLDSSRATGALSKLKSGAKAMGVAVASYVAIAGTALVKFISKLADTGDNIGKMSKRTGIGVEELQRYQHAATLSGASLEGLEKSLVKMQTAVYEAGRGTATYTDALAAIGLSYSDLASLSPEKQFEKVLTALAATEDKTTQSAVALKVFGKNGKQLIPMLSEGADGLAKMKDEMDSLGLLTDKQVKDMEDYKDSITRVKQAFFGLLAGVLAPLVPQITTVLAALTKKIADMRANGQLDEIAKSLATALTNLQPKLMSLIDDLDGITQSAKDIHAVFGPVIKLFMVGFGVVNATVTQIVHNVVMLSETLQALKNKDWSLALDFAIEGVKGGLNTLNPKVLVEQWEKVFDDTTKTTQTKASIAESSVKRSTTIVATAIDDGTDAITEALLDGATELDKARDAYLAQLGKVADMDLQLNRVGQQQGLQEQIGQGKDRLGNLQDQKEAEEKNLADKKDRLEKLQARADMSPKQRRIADRDAKKAERDTKKQADKDKKILGTKDFFLTPAEKRRKRVLEAQQDVEDAEDALDKTGQDIKEGEGEVKTLEQTLENLSKHFEQADFAKQVQLLEQEKQTLEKVEKHLNDILTLASK